MASETIQPRSRRVMRTSIGVLFVGGVVCIGLTALLGFEQPSTTLLVLCCALLVAPVVVVFTHLYLTKALTAVERRVWFQHLTGPRAMWAIAEYLSCDDLSAAAEKLNRERPGKGV